MDELVSDTPECWKVFNENPQYKISNHGRVLNLKSYGNKPRYITPTLRFGKYLFVTIWLEGKRKTIRLEKLRQLLFD
jgi:hypothetical protein